MSCELLAKLNSMKVSFFNRALPVVAAIATLVLASGCNRGVGCPSNFSLNDFFIGVVKAVITALF
jgi:hypothetical protein